MSFPILDWVWLLAVDALQKVTTPHSGVNITNRLCRGGRKGAPQGGYFYSPTPLCPPWGPIGHMAKWAEPPPRPRPGPPASARQPIHPHPSPPLCNTPYLAPAATAARAPADSSPSLPLLALMGGRQGGRGVAPSPQRRHQRLHASPTFLTVEGAVLERRSPTADPPPPRPAVSDW